MPPIRILQMVPWLGCGGAERMCATLVTHLDRQRFEVELISLYDPHQTALEKYLERLGVRVSFLGKRKGFDPRMFRRIAGVARRFRPHLAHTHLCLHYGIPLRVLWPGTVLLDTVHSVVPLPLGDPARTPLFNRFLRPLGIVRVAVSHEVARSVQLYYGISCRVIPNGIPLAAYRSSPARRHEWRRQQGFSPDDVIFVCVARLRAVKQHALLLEAFCRVAAENPRAHLVCVGEGDLLPSLIEEARKLRLEKQVHFIGIRADVPDVLAASDVFVLPSAWEGNPLAVMEAMAAGLPVVATTVGGLPELVENGKQGLLIPARDKGALTAALRILLNQPGLRGLLGAAAALRAVECFDARLMAQRYTDCYFEALSGLHRPLQAQAEEVNLATSAEKYR